MIVEFLVMNFIYLVLFVLLYKQINELEDIVAEKLHTEDEVQVEIKRAFLAGTDWQKGISGDRP